MSRRELPAVQRLHELLEYNPETGVLTWREARSNVAAGSAAGSTIGTHRVKVRIDGVLYLAHRVIWKMMTGEEPPYLIDHENLNGTDNRWKNLRAATYSLNCANRPANHSNRSGFKGVVRTRAKSERYVARIQVNGETIHLGSFGSREDANAAYQSAAISNFGEFARW